MERNTSTERWGFELLRDYNWLLNRLGGGAVVWLLGYWSAVTRRLQFIPMVFSDCDCRERLVLLLLSSNFQAWAHKLRRVK